MAGYNPNRNPAGTSEGGQFASGDALRDDAGQVDVGGTFDMRLRAALSRAEMSDTARLHMRWAGNNLTTGITPDDEYQAVRHSVLRDTAWALSHGDHTGPEREPYRDGDGFAVTADDVRAHATDEMLDMDADTLERVLRASDEDIEQALAQQARKHQLAEAQEAMVERGTQRILEEL